MNLQSLKIWKKKNSANFQKKRYIEADRQTDRQDKQTHIHSCFIKSRRNLTFWSKSYVFM